MNQSITTNSKPGTPLVASQQAPMESGPSEQLAISGELGLIALGLTLLAVSGYMFLLKVCKTLARSGNK